MIYTSGVWNAKEGHEDEFANRWEASVDQFAPDLPGVVFRLLRDVDNPSRFVSVAGPWRNVEQVDAVRSSPRFQESMAANQEILAGFELSTYQLVVEVS
jgi:heme-degrading monooxygenase HmoA